MNAWEQFQRIFRDGLRAIADGLGFAGTHRWALAIFVLTIIVRTLLLPLAIKQVRSMQAMQRLQPEVNRLRQKYKKDKQKMQQEMMELYRREGANPLSSCLPLLAQMPVLFAMYFAIRQITDPIAVGGLGITNMPFLGLANACVTGKLKVAGKMTEIVRCGLAAPSSKTVAGIVLLVLMTATSFLSTRQMTAHQDPQQARISQIMPIVFVFVFLNFPGALVLYWTIQNLYQLVQQTIMLRTKTIELPPPRRK